LIGVTDDIRASSRGQAVLATLQFEELFTQEFAQVFKAATHFVGDRAEAHDIASEAFARAWANWNKVGQEAWAGAWVMTTALNIARRRCRRRTCLKRLTLTKENPPKTDFDVADRMWVKEGILALPPSQRQLVILHYLSDLSIDDISRLVGISPGGVKSGLHKGRSRLRELLQNPNEEGEIDGPDR
jgi:RNA polymerase sigma-70 factor (ECF subfamily)